jgi:hypothetical protein
MIYMLSHKEQKNILDEWKRSHHIGQAGLAVLNLKRFKTSNSEFSKNDARFIEACRKAEVVPSLRQASKFRSGYGKAFRHN